MSPEDDKTTIEISRRNRRRLNDHMDRIRPKLEKKRITADDAISDLLDAAGVRVELMDHEEEARLALDAIAHVDEQIALARGTPVDHRTRRALQDRKDGIYDNTKWGVAP